MNLLSVLDVTSLAAVWWTLFAIAEVSPSASRWPHAFAACALLAAQAVAGITLLAVAARPVTAPWWAHVAFVAAGVAAGVVYDRRFGICRHCRMAFGRRERAR